MILMKPYWRRLKVNGEASQAIMSVKLTLGHMSGCASESSSQIAAPGWCARPSVCSGHKRPATDSDSDDLKEACVMYKVHRMHATSKSGPPKQPPCLAVVAPECVAPGNGLPPQESCTEPIRNPRHHGLLAYAAIIHDKAEIQQRPPTCRMQADELFASLLDAMLSHGHNGPKCFCCGKEFQIFHMRMNPGPEERYVKCTVGDDRRQGSTISMQVFPQGDLLVEPYKQRNTLSTANGTLGGYRALVPTAPHSRT